MKKLLLLFVCLPFSLGVSAQKASDYRQAAEAGNMTALANLGVCYLDGLGVEPDYRKAVACFRKAAAQDIPAACYNLANCYYKGQGVPQDRA